jgi:hypothetical protein
MATEFGIIPIRIGEATDAALRRELGDFYEQVCSLIVGDRVCNIHDRDSIRTIGLRQSRVRNERSIYDVVVPAFRRIPETVKYLIIDLANPPREEFAIDAIVRAIITSLTEVWWAKSSKLAVILVNQPISASAFAYTMMSSHIAAGRLAVIDRRGSLHGEVPARPFNHGDYASALRAVQDDPMVLLQRKMIRRIGHFRHGGRGAGRSTKFYYDGHRCKIEITTLLTDFLAKAATKQLLVHAPISPWLVDVAEGVSIDRRLKLLDLSVWMNGQKIAGKNKRPSIPSNPCVLVSMVDTGRTIERIHAFLRGCNSNCKPRYFSVMSTEVTDSDRRTRTISTKDGTIEISYLLHVKQQAFDAAAVPHCLKDHDGSNFDIEGEPRRLTSYAFWNMISEVGFKEEEDVPNTRKSLGFVPRFPELLEANSPLLAHKIEKLLWPVPLDSVFICADENGARALTNCIRTLTPSSVIRIPRPVIDQLPLNANPASILGKLREEFGEQEWFKRLISMGAGGPAQAILVDEFTSSGETFRRLSNVCASVRLQIVKSVVLVDFGVDDGARPIPIEYLYRLPLGGVK